MQTGLNQKQRVLIAMADPGFPKWGEPTQKGGGYYLAIFYRKLHENQEKWTKDGLRPKFYYIVLGNLVIFDHIFF